LRFRSFLCLTIGPPLDEFSQVPFPDPPEPPAADLKCPKPASPDPADHRTSLHFEDRADFFNRQETFHSRGLHVCFLYVSLLLIIGHYRPFVKPTFYLFSVHVIIPKMNPEYFSKKDLMAYLKISAATVGRLMQQGLPYIKLSRRVLFKREDVDAFLETKRIVVK